MNGLYLLRLRAEDVNGAAAEVTRAIAVDGQAKIGVFRISFVDLQIPMSGIPITVVRTYDSRVKTEEDFGVGWTLDVVSGEVTQKVDFKTGWVIATSDKPFSLPCQIVRDQKDHLTEIRLSERERYRFRPTLENAMSFSGGCRADVGFALVDGTTPNATLQVIGNTGVRAPGATIHDDDDPIPTIGTLTDELEGTPYEPRAFRLTTEDGRVVDLRQGFGITRIEDRNGNQLFVSAAGISHSGGESVSFTRDGARRITRIVDPMGKTLDYGYDAAGDLVSFENQTDDRTTFVVSAQRTPSRGGRTLA